MNDQVTKEETAEILRLAEQALAAEGDFVELGCYRGDTSILLGQLLRKHANSTIATFAPANSASTKTVQSLANSVSTPVPPVENPTFACGKPVEKSVATCGKDVQNSSNPVQNQPENVEKLSKSCGNPAPDDQSAPRRLWIYDSFAGLPEKTREDASGAGANFQKGELLVTKREVIDKIRKHGLKNVIIKKAWFDDLTDKDLPTQIAFAFCDGDLYSSIKTSLRLVLPRLAERGTIIVHDYNNPELPGSARAVDEFLRAHPDFKLQVRHTLAILTKRQFSY